MSRLSPLSAALGFGSPAKKQAGYNFAGSDFTPPGDWSHRPNPYGVPTHTPSYDPNDYGVPTHTTDHRDDPTKNGGPDDPNRWSYNPYGKDNEPGANQQWFAGLENYMSPAQPVKPAGHNPYQDADEAARMRMYQQSSLLNALGGQGFSSVGGSF